MNADIIHTPNESDDNHTPQPSPPSDSPAPSDPPAEPEEISADDDSSPEKAPLLPDPQLQTALLMARLELLLSQTHLALPPQK